MPMLSMPCIPPYLGRVATTSLRRPTVASHPPSTVTSRPGTLPDESCANAVTTRIHAGRRGAAGRSVAEERRSSRKRIGRLRYDPQSGGDPSDVSREPAVPSTWRGVEDRSRRACAGVGSGLVPLCLPRPSLSGPQRGEEESGKFNANKDLDAPDRGWRRVLVTYIASRGWKPSGVRILETRSKVSRSVPKASAPPDGGCCGPLHRAPPDQSRERFSRLYMAESRDSIGAPDRCQHRPAKRCQYPLEERGPANGPEASSVYGGCLFEFWLESFLPIRDLLGPAGIHDRTLDMQSVWV